MKSTARLRTLLYSGFHLAMFASVFFPSLAQGQVGQSPLKLHLGPHLFIDEHLIEEQSFLSRTVNQPPKLRNPIVTGGKAGDDSYQSYLSVVRDASSGMFRLWYNTSDIPDQAHQKRSHIGYMESRDGVNWIRPHRVLKDPEPIMFSCSVIDRGPLFQPADQRFVLSFYQEGYDGMKSAVSPDGIDWRMLAGQQGPQFNNESLTVQWDSLRQQYIMIGSDYMEYKGWPGSRRRIPHESVSRDLLQWEKPWPIIMPKIGASFELGEMQFYSMAGVTVRGDLLIGLVKVLRDDLNATAGKTGPEMGDTEPRRKAAGLGYTVLAWSRDGLHWQRDHEPFLANDPDPVQWDHAMAWGDAQIISGDETFIYYGGYKRGHKVARFEERQIGLARMPRDRYVAREADLNLGRLISRPLELNAQKLTVNARVVGGLRVRLLDEAAKPVPGFDWAEIRGDSVSHLPGWKGGIEKLKGRTVRLEFELRNAQLFGFDLQ